MGLCSGLCWDNGKENGNYYLGFRGFSVRVRVFELAWRLMGSYYHLGLGFYGAEIRMNITR